MNHPEASQHSAFSKIISIFIVITIVVILTAAISGGYVFWWQKATSETEKSKLKQQIIKLQNEIKLLKSNKTINSKPQLESLSKQNNPKKNVLPNNMLSGREKNVITILKRGDFAELANYIHPVKGVRFSPYSYVDLKKDIVFNRIQLQNLFNSHKRYIWGYQEETGMPLRLTPADYYQHYIYDRDYEYAQEVNYNRNNYNIDFTISNCFEAYPKATIVEFRFNDQTVNWSSIRLVFEEMDKIWYLVGIIHDQWQL